MSLHKNDHAEGRIPMPISVASEQVTERCPFSLSGDLAVNDIIQLGEIPAGHLMDDLVLDFDAMGAGATFSVGFLNADKDDLDLTESGGVAWIADGDVAAAGALRATGAGLRALKRVARDSDNDRPFGIKVTTDSSATTGVVAASPSYHS